MHSPLQRILDIDMTDDSKLSEQYDYLLVFLSGELEEALPVGVPQDMCKFDGHKMAFLQEKLMERAYICGNHGNKILDNLERLYDAKILMNDILTYAQLNGFDIA